MRPEQQHHDHFINHDEIPNGRRKRDRIFPLENATTTTNWIYTLDEFFLTMVVLVNQPLLWMGRTVARMVWSFVTWMGRSTAEEEEEEEEFDDDDLDSVGSSVSLLPIQDLEIPLLPPAVDYTDMPISIRAATYIRENETNAAGRNPNGEPLLPYRRSNSSLVPPNILSAFPHGSVGAEEEDEKILGEEGEEAPAPAKIQVDSAPGMDESSSITSDQQQSPASKAAKSRDQPMEVELLMAAAKAESPLRDHDRDEKPRKRKKHKKDKKKKHRRNSIPKEIYYTRSLSEEDDEREEMSDSGSEDSSSFNQSKRKHRTKRSKSSPSEKKPPKSMRKKRKRVQLEPVYIRSGTKRSKQDPSERDDVDEDDSSVSRKYKPIPPKFNKLPESEDDLPRDYKDLFHEIGFCDWKRVMLPCLIVSPFDFDAKSPVRKSWFEMAKRHLKLHKRLDEGDLPYFVYWYTDQTYSMIDNHKFVFWEDGNERWHTLPKYLVAKLEQDKSLTEVEAMRVEGTEAALEACQKSPHLRTHPQMVRPGKRKK